jgi:hypothetical protein
LQASAASFGGKANSIPSGDHAGHGSSGEAQLGSSSSMQWQQQQYHGGGLYQQPAMTLEDADRLERLLRELLHNIMRMREVHR